MSVYLPLVLTQGDYPPEPVVQARTRVDRRAKLFRRPCRSRAEAAARACLTACNLPRYGPATACAGLVGARRSRSCDAYRLYVFSPFFLLFSQSHTNSLVATSTLFRGNSIFTKAMEFTMRFYGRSFLDASVGPVIRRLCNERVEIRLDPSSHALSQREQDRPRSSGRDGAADATRTLAYWCNEFWCQIYNVRTECPM